MPDELLSYYEKELAYVRQLGAEFAEEHPKIAGRLGLNSDHVEDPHVARLVESFAYLNARIQHKLDDDFPEISDALLNVVFPHYQRPLPSMSIAQFVPDKDQLDSRYHIAANTLVETEHFQGENCRFSSVYDVELLPAEVSSASLIGAPLATPGAAMMPGAQSCLHIRLQSFDSALPFSEFSFDKLRFYLKGQAQHVHPMYELLLEQCSGIALAKGDDDLSPVIIDCDHVQAVGFEEDQALLPYPAASFQGYRLLTEFFCFPEKFMFVDVDGLKDFTGALEQNELNLYFYFEKSNVELEHNIRADNFVLGCSPIVNLFQHEVDPIQVDQSQSEYHVLADVRRPRGYEIYSIDSVNAVSPDGSQHEYLPFYGQKHSYQGNDHRAYWHASRRHAKLSNYERDDASDVFLSLVDLNFDPNSPQEKTLMIQATCSNRDLPEKLPYNNEQPRLQCVDGAPPCERIRCLTQPSATIRPPLRNKARWRLISHLSLNRLSLTGRDNPTGALKELLRLYDFKESSVTRALINAIDNVSCRQISAPISIDGRPTMCRGIEVELIIDDMLLSGSSAYLFASVLERFFALYCSVNSFSKTSIRLKNKEGYLKRCPIRSGEQVLL
ncbi:type VI secretion system baseplate subunit TssF [Agaribacterium haliotis]|uniref:type VI secretion system baseplate subunit TssF n=1 Tax=Agaribacterium haliotis TaxID=2013869 RepID=UPI000BB5479E|nr:type VI secretion system baseplate subunit TssF [Agaribacterium haliotis]